MDFHQQEIVATIEIEANLRRAEQYIFFQMVDRANDALNQASVSHRALNRLYRKRRGVPRKVLWVRVHYYEIWYRALAGLTKASEGYGIGAALLSKALRDANDLVRLHPNSSEFKELLRKATEWHTLVS